MNTDAEGMPLAFVFKKMSSRVSENEIWENIVNCFLYRLLTIDLLL